MNSFFSSKKNVIALVVGILVLLVIVPVVAIVINLVIDQAFFAEKRSEAERVQGLGILKLQLEEYAREHGTFPRAEEGGVQQALGLPFDFSDIFQYAYCVEESGVATYYHMAVQGIREFGGGTGANFNSSIPDTSLNELYKCTGDWYLENGTPGGFDGNEVYDIACGRELLCRRLNL